MVAPLVGLAPTSNGAQEELGYSTPYEIKVTLRGVAPILFHAWNNEAVEAKGKAAKNSKAKKTDNIESYVYRTPSGTLGIPGENLKATIVEVGRFHQDPRSSRKSMLDLLKAAIIPLTEVADTGAPTWDYIDRHRVTVQRAAITRERPALRAGWEATFEFLIATPEYVSPDLLLQLLNEAGRLIGLCDHRPTYGRFQVVNFERLQLHS